MIFTASELDYLTSQPLGRMATQQPDGTLQASPVSFRIDSVTHAIEVHGFRMATSRKYRNVAENGRVAFVVDDLASTTPWRPCCIEIRGRAEATVDDRGEPIIRIAPARVISFGIDERDTPAHQLTIHTRDVG